MASRAPMASKSLEYIDMNDIPLTIIPKKTLLYRGDTLKYIRNNFSLREHEYFAFTQKVANIYGLALIYELIDLVTLNTIKHFWTIYVLLTQLAMFQKRWIPNQNLKDFIRK